MDLVKKIRYAWHASWRQPSVITGLFSKLLGYFVFRLTVWGYVYTKPDSFTPAQKPFRIGLFLTHKNGDFDAISVTERSCAARISKVKSHIEKLGIVWSKPKFFSLFGGPFLTGKSISSNSATKLNNFSTKDKKKNFVTFKQSSDHVCIRQMCLQWLSAKMSSYLGKH